MAKRRVLAHYMHETERDEVARHLSNSVVGEGLAYGEIEESDMEGLRKSARIVFQMLDEPRGPARAGSEDAAQRVVAATLNASYAPSPTVPPSPSNCFYLKLTGPLFPAWRTQLESLGVDFREAKPEYQWVTRIPMTSVPAVRELNYVLDVRMRESDRNLPTRQEMSSFGSTGGQNSMVTYDVRLDPKANTRDFLGILQSKNVSVAAAEGDKVRIFLQENDPRLDEISRLTDLVIDIQPYLVPELHNDEARVLLGVDSPPGSPPPFALQGETEIIAIADTGLDETHPDFHGRIIGVRAWGRPPSDATDPHGHGTHVAGSALGDGTASGGSIKGAAPRAKLFFQSLLDKNFKLGGIPLRLETLFAEAYAAGARIHNNSWGTSSFAAYRMDAREVDEYVYKQKDMLVVISAGNDGTAADPPFGQRNVPPGEVDWLSVGSPATARNALTVGAYRSPRTVNGYSTLTYGSVWPQKFPLAPSLTDSVSGDVKSIAAFSSRGPCDDYRIKPDVVAPGTDILSCKSALAPPFQFWGPDTAGRPYAYWGGTSMAAPLVAGCAALIRQYYVTTRAHQPSAALLKATIINSTRWLTGRSSVEGFAEPPNYHQGFGAVFLPTAIPNAVDPTLKLEFHDNWQDPAQHFTSTGLRKRFTINVNAGRQLRFTLAYTDAPGRALQNNLQLFVDTPDGQRLYGNMRLPRGNNRPDTVNNVERLVIDAPVSGAYLVKIDAANIFMPQDFALVVTGDLTSPLTEI
jgi:serine protease AprX